MGGARRICRACICSTGHVRQFGGVSAGRYGVGRRLLGRDRPLDAVGAQRGEVQPVRRLRRAVEPPPGPAAGIGDVADDHVLLVDLQGPHPHPVTVGRNRGGVGEDGEAPDAGQDESMVLGYGGGRQQEEGRSCEEGALHLMVPSLTASANHVLRRGV
ncbi:hypothetical protein D3C81_1687170 [compost metagenome]